MTGARISVLLIIFFNNHEKNFQKSFKQRIGCKLCNTNFRGPCQFQVEMGRNVTQTQVYENRNGASHPASLHRVLSILAIKERRNRAIHFSNPVVLKEFPHLSSQHSQLHLFFTSKAHRSNNEDQGNPYVRTQTTPHIYMGRSIFNLFSVLFLCEAY